MNVLGIKVKDGEEEIKGGVLSKGPGSFLVRFVKPITHDTYLKAFENSEIAGIDTMYYWDKWYVSEIRATDLKINKEIVKVYSQ